MKRVRHFYVLHSRGKIELSRGSLPNFAIVTDSIKLYRSRDEQQLARRWLENVARFSEVCRTREGKHGNKA